MSNGRSNCRVFVWCTAWKLTWVNRRHRHSKHAGKSVYTFVLAKLRFFNRFTEPFIKQIALSKHLLYSMGFFCTPPARWGIVSFQRLNVSIINRLFAMRPLPQPQPSRYFSSDKIYDTLFLFEKRILFCGPCRVGVYFAVQKSHQQNGNGLDLWCVAADEW